MSNEIAEMIKVIQYKTGKTLEDIASDIGYTRPYLNKAKNSGGGKNIINKLQNVFSEILNDTNSTIKKPKVSYGKPKDQSKEIFKLKRDVLELKQNIVDIEEIMEAQEAQLKSLFNRLNRSNAS